MIGCAAASLAAQDAKPTFTKDVAPVLQKHCQSCHRPGQAAPFSLISYEQARPWAKAMKAAVLQKKMPPWFAEGGVGRKFANDPTMPQSDVDALIAWADSGAAEGDPKDMPAPKQFVEGWSIPKPDVVFQLPKPFQVPAKGILEYKYIIIPTGFTSDTWVQHVQAAPTDYSVVHHIVAYVRTPGSNYYKNMPKNEFFEAPPSKEDKSAPKDDVPQDWLTGFAPGQPPDMFKAGQAKLIPAGSDIVLEIHYMPEGKEAWDQTRLGLVLAKEPPAERTMTLSAGNSSFKIPPHDGNYRVDASLTMPEDVTLLGLHPHMHMRGKSAEYSLVFPDGRKETLLNVPRYNWRWQLWYDLEEPLRLPKGTKLQCTEHFDNSANNPDNPDPTKTVIWGQQSFDEMMVCMINVSFDAKITTKRMLAPEKPKPAKTEQKATTAAEAQ
jgi:hypothetical protein